MEDPVSTVCVEFQETGPQLSPLAPGIQRIPLRYLFNVFIIPCPLYGLVLNPPPSLGRSL